MKKTFLSILVFLCITQFVLAQGDPKQVPQDQVETEGKLIEAIGQFGRGNFEEARVIYEEILKKQPHNATAAFFASKCYKEDNPEKELALLQQAHRHDKSNHYMTLDLAFALSKAGRHHEASLLFEELFLQFPKRTDFLVEQAKSLSQSGKGRQAYRLIEKYLNDGGYLTPELGQEKYNIAVAMNDKDVAIRALEELRAAYPKNPDYYQELAQFYRRSGDENSAIQVWKNMKELFPQDPRSKLGLAGQSKLSAEEDEFIQNLHVAFQDPEIALDDKILKMLPIVKELAARGDTVLANKVLPLAKTLTTIHGDSPKSHAIYADILLHARRSDEAINAYKKTLALDPSVYLVWDQLLLSLAETGNYKELTEKADEALLLFPNQSRLYYYLGKGYGAIGKVSDGIQTLEEGKIFALQDQVALFDIETALAELNARSGDFKAAQTSIDKALKIRPKNGSALARKAEFYLRTDEIEKAKSYLKKATSESPQNPYVLAIEGLAYVYESKLKPAKSSLESAFKYGGTTWSSVLEIAGDIAFLSGNSEEAIQFWKNAKALGGGSYKLNDKINKGQYVK